MLGTKSCGGVLIPAAATHYNPAPYAHMNTSNRNENAPEEGECQGPLYPDNEVLYVHWGEGEGAGHDDFLGVVGHVDVYLTTPPDGDIMLMFLTSPTHAHNTTVTIFPRTLKNYSGGLDKWAMDSGLPSEAVSLALAHYNLRA